ncbi:hypothetical protein F5051DRAFT_422461 [Lentinula edodes]|nr:hypothetical protein F5051DRAFT_422461 [Lentinula edodes]
MVSFCLLAFEFTFSILKRYANIHTAMRASEKSTVKPPLLLLIPFLFSARIQVAWLSHPELSSSSIDNYDYQWRWTQWCI